MADIKIYIQNSAVGESEVGTLCKRHVIGHYVYFGITMTSFTYGVTSWFLIKKFRKFNNYVYTSAVFVNILRLTLMSVTDVICHEVFQSQTHFFLFVYITTVYNYWLLVMCYMFYVDIVKVFHKNVTRKFLKFTIFAWGVPAVVIIILRLIFLIVERTFEGDKEVKLLQFFSTVTFVSCNILPLIINFCIFMKLVYNLFFCKTSNNNVVPQNERLKENLRRLFTATVMFMLININVLTLVIWEILNAAFPMRAITLYLQIIVLALFFPLLKSNRALWGDYFKRNTS